ncbi:MAG: UbiA family prenyltransferase [Smithellaceae bacterium]
MGIKAYISISRPDHWFKNIFLMPGVAIAYIEVNASFLQVLPTLIIGIIATCLIASANYVINEYIDSEYDRFHPVKKNRTAVTQNLSVRAVAIEYMLFLLIGFSLAWLVNLRFLAVSVVFAGCGIFYNVKPFRLKDVVYIDVLFESFNNVIRLLLGWFIVTQALVPPASLLIAFWMAGAFLMTSKRLAEYRQIGDREIAGRYRRSFFYYTEQSLLMSAVFYAIFFAFLFGIFLFKYRIEYILTFPLFSILFVWYLGFSLKTPTQTHDPENVYKEKWLMIYVGIIILFIISRP